MRPRAHMPGTIYERLMIYKRLTCAAAGFDRSVWERVFLNVVVCAGGSSAARWRRTARLDILTDQPKAYDRAHVQPQAR